MKLHEIALPRNEELVAPLLELNVICEQKWIQFELQNSPRRFSVFDGKIFTNILQTCEIGSQLKIFDIFRKITLQQKKFS